MGRRPVIAIVFAIVALCCAQNVAAQTDSVATMGRKGGLKGFLARALEVDTNYVEPNHYKATVMLLGEKRFNYYRLRGGESDQEKGQQLVFSPDLPFKIGPYVGYSIIFLGYTIDVEASKATLGTTNFYFSLYTRFLGIDYTFESGTRDYTITSASGFGSDVDTRVRGMRFSGLNNYLQNWHIYYIFNNKKFSYPAAYNQSTNQRRSAGSFILGFNYAKEKVIFDYERLPELLLSPGANGVPLKDAMKMRRVAYRNYSFSLGYSYNWVFARNCLANLSLTPTLGYNLSDGERFNREKLFNLKDMNFDLISRAGVVWNNTKYYVGSSLVLHTYSYSKPDFSINNALITLNVYAGVNILRKKK